jgi:hypothetical protein
MGQYVILRHETPGGSPRPTHWDLMFDMGSALRTWALDREPAESACIEALLLADHRRAYLDYEGPLSGDRGKVTRWDSGEFELRECSDERWVVELRGGRLRGTVVLERIAPQDQRWRLLFTASSAAT